MATEKIEGLSLALCVADILGGYVQEGEVSRIFSSASAPSDRDFEKIIEGYTRSYWNRQPEEGKSIARRFRDAGKLEFAGVQDCSDGHWRAVAIVSPLDIDAKRRDREALGGGVSWENAKMKKIRFKPAEG